MIAIILISFYVDDSSTQKRSVQSSRNLCHHFSKTNGLSCGFHDSCTEEIFECSSKGFHIGYSKPRCEAVVQLQQSSDSCENCLNHQEIVEWAQKTEECFQPKLQHLAESWADKIAPLSSPDPHHCIKYEIDALKELKKCYEQEIYPVCNLMSDVLNSTIVDDLQKLVSALAVGSYYQPLVHDHLRELISKCPADSATETAKTALPIPMKKTLLCAASSDEDDVIEFVKYPSGINCPSKEGFVYADSGEFSDARDDFCRKKSPSDGNGGQKTSYRIIQYTPTPSCPEIAKGSYEVQYSSKNTFIFFKLSEADVPDTSCGNGIREAGEYCDTFSEVLMGSDSKYGCNESCGLLTNYECSTSQLEMSICSQSICGDGMRSSLEECDDGNNITNDGCSADCTIEPLSECTDLQYNSTSICKPVEQVSSTIVENTPVTTIQPSLTTVSTTSATTSSAAVTTSSISSSTLTRTVYPTQEPPPSHAPVSEQSSGSLRTTSTQLLWLTVGSLVIYLLFLR